MPNYVKQYTRKSQAERREEIIDAALLILGEHGVDGMTMARIAEAVGITPGALYRHFDSRNAILAAAVEVAIERAMSWVDTAGVDGFNLSRTVVPECFDEVCD